VSVLPARQRLTARDFGCGEALEAAQIAARVGQLYLYDGAPSVRAHLSARFAGVENIIVLDDAGLAALPPASVDMIVFFSVIQYIPRGDVPELLRGWHRLLASGGQLLLADVIPPGIGMLADIVSLLKTAWMHGFMLPALAGLVMTL